MAAKKINDGISGVITPVENNLKEPTVNIFIPLAADSAEGTVEQAEYVTVNGKTIKIPRGEYVDVKVPVFLQLRNRYPNL